MSAHLDHLGLSAPLPDGHNVNNGADDDASGCTGLLAAARAFAEGAAKGMRPKRSIVFLWMGGEEKGLWGSQYFVQFPSIDVAKIVANLNMDMIGRTKNPNSVDTDATHVLVNQGEVLVVGPNISSDDLEQTIEAVNGAYQKLTLNHFYDVTAPDATHDNLGPRPTGSASSTAATTTISPRWESPSPSSPPACTWIITAPPTRRRRSTTRRCSRSPRRWRPSAGRSATRPARPKLKATLPDQLVKDMKTAQTQGWGKLTPVLPPLPGEPY
jgi:hypothetical protein